MLEFALIPHNRSKGSGRHEPETGPEPAGAWRELALCSTAAAREKVPFDKAAELCVLPMGVLQSQDEDVLTVLVAETPDAQTLGQLRFLTSCRVIVDLAPKQL